MAKVTGPLLSFDASGQIAQTQVYSRWKGRKYVRRYLIPANPRSSEQTLTRSVFTWLSNTWQVSQSDFQAPWRAGASNQVMTDRNLWMKRNVSLLRTGVDLTGLVLSPGARGGLNTTVALTGAAGAINITVATPSLLPSGWTIISATSVAILQQDPHNDTDYTMYTGTDLTSPYAPNITGLAAGDYVAGAWLVFQRSASLTDLAYGASIADEVTVT
jgi:hypothetical protein